MSVTNLSTSYGDAACLRRSYITSEHRGTNLTDVELRDVEGARMCGVGFGEVVNGFAFCDFKKLKHFLQPVGHLLRNFHTM
jgi:hypothetical protein